MRGFEELKRSNVIDEFFIYKNPGMQICGAETSGDRPAGYLITATSKEELVTKQRYVDSHIEAIAEKGEDMMLHNLLS